MLTLLTVQLELGPETRVLVERVATNAVVQLELGPKTLTAIEAMGVAAGTPKKAKAVEAIEGLLGKGTDATSSE